MNKRVFIIKGFAKTIAESDAFDNYVSNYSSYFCSNAGGAYEDAEISILPSPTSNELKGLIKITTPEFAIIVFIGHGANQNNFQLFQINKNEIINAGQLMFEIDKQLIILESCRVEIKNIPTVDLSEKVPSFRPGGKFKFPISREKAKQTYENHIQKCDKGMVVCYACSKGQTASNFYYSKSLLQKANDWHNDFVNNNPVLSISDIMSQLTSFLPGYTKSKINKEQTPAILNPIYFPFAVSKY